jgi:hypothetical protein
MWIWVPIRKIGTFSGNGIVAQVRMTRTIWKASWLPGFNFQAIMPSCIPRLPPSRKIKVAVCEEISKKIKQAKTLKISKAPSVQMKIQAMEAPFHEPWSPWMGQQHGSWCPGEGQTSLIWRGSQKKFMYYYDLVDITSERASVGPKASTDTMNMRGSDDDNDNISSSSSSIPVTGKDEEEDGDVSSAAKLAKAKAKAKAKANANALAAYY